MQCNCESELTEKLKEKLKKDYPNSNKHIVEIGGYGVFFEKGGLVTRPILPITFYVTVTNKKGITKDKKINSNLACNYCPICGKPVNEPQVMEQTP